MTFTPRDLSELWISRCRFVWRLARIVTLGQCGLLVPCGETAGCTIQYVPDNVAEQYYTEVVPDKLWYHLRPWRQQEDWTTAKNQQAWNNI